MTDLNQDFQKQADFLKLCEETKIAMFLASAILFYKFITTGNLEDLAMIGSILLTGRYAAHLQKTEIRSLLQDSQTLAEVENLIRGNEDKILEVIESSPDLKQNDLN